MKNKVFTVIEMLVVIAAGLILLFKPGDTLITATRILGAALLACAVVSALAYLLGKEKHVSLLASAAFASLLGLVLLVIPKALASVFPFIAGAVVVIAGIRSLASAFASRSVSHSWVLGCVFAVVTILLGVLLLFRPFEAAKTVARVLGIILIYVGATGIVTAAKA